jgi:hypothetical protein
MLSAISEGASMSETPQQAARRLLADKLDQGYVPRALHEWRAADGSTLYWRARLEHPDGDAAADGRKVIRPLHLNGHGYKLGEPSFPNGKPLYNLDRIAAHPTATVWIAEGEKATDALTKIGAVATTSGSATSAGKADWSVLRGRTCIIWPDNDDPGRAYAGDVAAILLSVGCTVSCVDIAKLNMSAEGDAADWQQTHQNAVLGDVEALPLLPCHGNAQSEPEADPKERETQAERLIALAKAHAQLAWIDEDAGLLIAKAPKGSGRRCYRIPSSQAETWLRGLYYAETKRGLAKATFGDAVATLLAACRHEGKRVEAAVRVAEIDGTYWIDIGDDTGRAVKIAVNGWSIIDQPDVYFIRPRDSRPLPEPTPCALEDVEEILAEHLFKHVNVADEDCVLLLAAIVEALRPDTPYVVVDLDGAQGSAKSTTQRRIRALIDPHEVMLRGRPKSVEDFWVAANNGYVVSYENLSGLTPEQQDALCSLATGAGHAGRTLYSNTEETTIKAKRPIIINGIGSAATRPDLIDRTVHFELAEIPDAQRRTEVQIEAEWRESYPRAFGAILTLFARALAVLPTIRLNEKPRMADFATLGCAVAEALGKNRQSFLDRYAANRREGAQRALDAYPVGHAVIRLVHNATPADKLTFTWQALYDRVVTQDLRDGAPRTARGLSALLKKITPALKLHGVIIERGAHGRAGNEVTLKRIPT